MDKQSFNYLLLKTAFSCMACDGNIDMREVKLVKHLAIEDKLFGTVDIDSQLDNLIHDINEDGHQFMRDYFEELNQRKMSEDEELKIIKVSTDILNADQEVTYSEIKFFKVIRSKLAVSTDRVLELYPEIEEYMEQDIITESYLLRIQEDFFDTQIIPKFEQIHELGEDVLKKLADDEEVTGPEPEGQ